jgi:tRNA(fMet)-specific endonuclease VapC
MKMNGDYLLDTNVVIALFRAELDVRNRITAAQQIYLPVAVVAELWYGALGSQQSEQNLHRLEQFVISNSVLNCDLLTARHYAEIKTALKVAGTPIPENDIWIAATARQYGLSLATRDTHFSRIADLSVENW